MMTDCNREGNEVSYRPRQPSMFERGMRSLLGSAADRARWQRLRHARRAARAMLETHALISAEEHVVGTNVPYRMAIPSEWGGHVLTIALVLVAVVASSSLGTLPRGQPPAMSDPRSSRDDPRVIPRELASVPLALPALSADPLLDEARIVGPYRDSTVYTEFHTLVAGERLGDIAAMYGVTADTLFWTNDLVERDALVEGTELRIPRIAGIPYTVVEGDTIDSIGEQFNVPAEALMLFEQNGLEADETLVPGRQLFIPGARKSIPDDVLSRFSDLQIADAVVMAVGSVRESQTILRTGPGRDYPLVGVLDAARRLRPVARHADWAKVEDDRLGTGWVRADLLVLSDDAFRLLPIIASVPPPPPIWVWPSYGTITSLFGWRSTPFRSFHNGLDIANRAGTAIVAARAGRVTEAGWCSGYGYCVRLSHGDGMSTIYGHLLRKPNVGVGESVIAGDLIGLMGSTYDAAGGGYSTGVHLHFTVTVNGQAVDPLRYLP
jgi:murein DD-endopeptidase MepM/ murein hydrolase activator NlpD